MLSYLHVAIGSAAGGLARFVVGTWRRGRPDDWAPRTAAAPSSIGFGLLAVLPGSFVARAVMGRA